MIVEGLGRRHCKRENNMVTLPLVEVADLFALGVTRCVGKYGVSKKASTE